MPNTESVNRPAMQTGRDRYLFRIAVIQFWDQHGSRALTTNGNTAVTFGTLTRNGNPLLLARFRRHGWPIGGRSLSFWREYAHP